MRGLRAFALLLALFSSVAGANSMNNRFGLGVAIGSPTAIVGKYYKDPSHAIDGGIGYFFSNYFNVYVDYLFHWPRAFADRRNPAPQFVPYMGIGLGMAVAGSNQGYYDNSHPSVGIYARVPFGIEWLAPRAPLGVFLELVPDFQLIPGLWLGFGGALGIRYYF